LQFVVAAGTHRALRSSNQESAMHDTDFTQNDGRSAGHLTRMILDYLAEHPQATDTVEGIAEWWVRRQEVRSLVDNVTAIVHRLTEAGILEQIGTGPRSRFRLARSDSRTIASTNHDSASSS
jgi:hypothetical protein